jgi:hypothetical protein
MTARIKIIIAVVSVIILSSVVVFISRATDKNVKVPEANQSIEEVLKSKNVSRSTSKNINQTKQTKARLESLKYDKIQDYNLLFDETEKFFATTKKK